MRGHWYVKLHRLDCTAEFAYPALSTPPKQWIQACCDSLPGDGWHYRDELTWRASYDQRSLPNNSQPTYGQLNEEQGNAAPIVSDVAPWSTEASPPQQCQCQPGCLCTDCPACALKHPAANAA